MSTTLTTEARWYREGARYGLGASLGFDAYPLVGRFKFQSPATGATSLSFASSAYGVYGGMYEFNDPGFHFLVTAESTGYESRVGTDLGSPTGRSGSSMTGSCSVQLMPNADYYLWIWPNSTLLSRIDPGQISVTVDGVYGTPSQISVSDGCFGTQIPVSLSVSTPGAEHSLTVSCAGRTEQLLNHSNASSCVWTPDLATYAALLPGSGSAQAVFSCETFYAGNSVGSRTETVTVRFAQGSLPPLLTQGWAAVSVYNAGAAAGMSACIQGYSRGEVLFDSTKISCRYGASVAGLRIRCAGVTVSAGPYRTELLTGDAEILCTVTDSRGQEAEETLHLSVLPYAPPRLTETAVFRCDSGGTAAEDGQYYSARGKALFSALNGENSVTITAAHRRSDQAAFGAETALQNDTARVIGTIDPDYSYLVRLTLTDRLGNTATAAADLATQRWAMKFRPGGRGVGFGKAPEHDNCIELPAGWVIRIGDRVIDGS